MSTTINQKADKRTRLIEAANELFHQQGVNITTLANIAALAEVPLGNVYYYFKSKESIVLTVIEQRRKANQQLFSSWNTLHATPKARLKAFIEQSITLNSETMAYGDALGSLCQELGKHGGEIALAAAGLMKEVLNFCETQFKAINPEEAEVWALNLVSNLQGINLLTLTFKDPAWLEKQHANLLNWLETL